tara:strand:+ start:3911 stop:5479 length:1569 start_codon:yes stop_codon:yes gene_type:complete
MHVNIDRVFTTVSRNLGLHDYGTYTDSWIEWAYEAEKLIGSISTFVHKEAVYSADGAKASGTIEFTSNPVSGDSIELNGATLYFRKNTDLGQAKSPNEIEIGDTLIHTMNSTEGQYGLIQSLIGRSQITQDLTFVNTSEAPLQGISTGAGVYANSAIYNYPEALNVAEYTVTENTGSDMITNGSFTGSSSGWSLAGTYAYGTNAIDSSAALYAHLIQNSIGAVSKKTYRITFTISNHVVGNLSIYMVGQEHTDGKYYKGTANVNSMTDGTYSVVLDTDEPSRTNEPGLTDTWWQAAQANSIRFSNQQVGVTHDFTIDDISVVEITSTQLNITAKEIGNKGNDYTLQSDTSNAKISGGSLSGGKDLYRNQQLRLPDDNIKMLAVRDSNHNELRKTSSVHTGRLGSDALRYYTQGNRLNIASTGVTELTVVYLAYPTDLRGWPMIKEGHETAVAQYIMWQQNLVKYYNGQIAQYIVKDLEKRWYLLCGKTRGDDGMPTSEELKQIGNIWNTMVPIKNNRGLIDL